MDICFTSYANKSKSWSVPGTAQPGQDEQQQTLLSVSHRILRTPDCTQAGPFFWFIEKPSML